MEVPPGAAGPEVVVAVRASVARAGIDPMGSVRTRVPLSGRARRSALVVGPDRVGLVFPPCWGKAEGPSFPTRGLGVVDLRTDAVTRLTPELWDESMLKLPRFGDAEPTLLLLSAEPCRVPPLRWGAGARWPHPGLRRREAASAEGLWLDGLVLAARRPDPLVRALLDAGVEQVTDPDAWLDRRRPLGQDLAGLERLRRTTEAERAATGDRDVRGARGVACGLLAALLVATIWGTVATLMGDSFYEGTEGTPALILAMVGGPFIGWLVGLGARRASRLLVVGAGVLALAAVVAGEALALVLAGWRATGTPLQLADAVDALVAAYGPGSGSWSATLTAVLHLLPAVMLAGGTTSLYRQPPRPSRPASVSPR